MIDDMALRGELFVWLKTTRYLVNLMFEDAGKLGQSYRCLTPSPELLQVKRQLCKRCTDATHLVTQFGIRD